MNFFNTGRTFAPEVFLPCRKLWGTNVTEGRKFSYNRGKSSLPAPPPPTPPPPPPPLPSFPILISEANEVQQIQFQKSAILVFMGVVPKLYGPEISRLLPCMLQFLDNLIHRENRSLHVRPSEKACYLMRDLMKSFLLWTPLARIGKQALP